MHRPGAEISYRDGKPQKYLLLGGFLCGTVVLLIYYNSEWLPLLALLALFFTGCSCMVLCLNQNAYGPVTDVLGDSSWIRGCYNEGITEVQPDDVVRALYQFSCYNRLKTTWPITLLYSFIAALALGSVITSSTSWILSIFVCFVTIVLTQAYITGFQRVHGDEQAQMFLDALFVKYKALRAFDTGKKAANSEGDKMARLAAT